MSQDFLVDKSIWRCFKAASSLRSGLQEAQIQVTAQENVTKAKINISKLIKTHQQEKAELLQRISNTQERGLKLIVSVKTNENDNLITFIISSNQRSAVEPN